MMVNTDLQIGGTAIAAALVIGALLIWGDDVATFFEDLFSGPVDAAQDAAQGTQEFLFGPASLEGFQLADARKGFLETSHKAQKGVREFATGRSDLPGFQLSQVGLLEAAGGPAGIFVGEATDARRTSGDIAHAGQELAGDVAGHPLSQATFAPITAPNEIVKATTDHDPLGDAGHAINQFLGDIGDPLGRLAFGGAA